MKDTQNIKLSNLQEKTIAVFGFGSQGVAQSLNLKESGLNVIIALRENSKNITIAEAQGFQVFTPLQAAKKADIILMLLPDETHAEVFQQEIRPYFKKGGTIVVAHGFSFHFGFVKDFAEYNIGMVAPKAVGKAVRKHFIEGIGIFSLYAIFNQVSQDLEEILTEIAVGIGSKKILKTDFKTECETDLFGEQAVLCGGVISLFRQAFEVLVEANYSPEIAYYECIHELKLIVDLIYEKGVNPMSNTAKYGGLKVGDYLIDESVKNRMKIVLNNIQDGSFAKSFMKASLEEKYAFKKEISEKYANTMLEKSGEIVTKITSNK